MTAAGQARGDDGRIRTFVAVDLEAPVLHALAELQRELASHSADVRWARPQGLHVTLKFLGPVEPGRLERVHLAVAGCVGDLDAVAVSVRGLGAFPSLRRPRVVWVGLDDGGRLAALAARVEAALEPIGFAREGRSFTPHVTLGRVNSARGWAPLEEAIRAHIDDEFGNSTVRGVIIYRSTLQRGGALYTPLWTISLTENRGTP